MRTLPADRDLRRPRTVRRLTVHPKASTGLPCPPGTTGVVSSDTDDHGIWDAATIVQPDRTVDIIYANTARAEVRLHPNTPIGYMQLIDPSESVHHGPLSKQQLMLELKLA